MGNDKRGWDDSLISLGLGALVVVVSGILLYNFFSSTSKDLLNDLAKSNGGQTSSTQIEEAQAPTSAPEDVAAGMVTPLPEESLSPSATAIAKASVKASPTLVAKVSPTVAPTQIAKASATVAPTQIAKVSPTAVATQMAKASVTPAASTVAEVTTTAPVTTSTEGTVKDSYTVERGDSLWKIAEKFYGSGYDWKTIQKANNLEGKHLVAGMTVEVPRKGMASSSATVATTTTPTGDGSTVSTSSTQPAVGGANTGTSSYTIVAGDSLTTIAYKSCGNQFLWTKIAQDNQISNPRMIHPGNVVQVTCAP